MKPEHIEKLKSAYSLVRDVYDDAYLSAPPDNSFVSAEFKSLHLAQCVNGLYFLIAQNSNDVESARSAKSTPLNAS